MRDLDTDDTQSNYDDRFINFKNKGVNNSESTFIDDNGTVKIQIDFSNNFGKIKRFTQFGDISVNEIKKNVPQKIINKQLYNIDYGKNQFEKFTDPYNTLIGVLNFVLNFLNISTSGPLSNLANNIVDQILSELSMISGFNSFFTSINNDSIGQFQERFLKNDANTQKIAVGLRIGTIPCSANTNVTSDSVVTNLQPKHFGYSPNYNPNRNDISKNNIKYSGSTPIEPYYDASHNTSSVTQTTHIRKLHLKSFVYINPETEEEVSSFAPVQMCWRLTLPNGNYDDAWKNISLYERVVNDSIRLATPGALDKDGNFAKIKNPEWYNFLNRDKFYNPPMTGDNLNTQKRI